MKTLKSSEKGTTLIEVLVTVIIMSIGLLGIAAMQTTSVQANQSSYFRSQATLLAADITDRMRANRTAALADDYTISAFPTSSTANAVSGTRTAKDKAEWLNRLGAAFSDGTGKIELASNIFTVSIRWNDRRGRIKSATDAANTTTDLPTFIYRARL
mgnify:FL=1